MDSLAGWKCLEKLSWRPPPKHYKTERANTCWRLRHGRDTSIPLNLTARMSNGNPKVNLSKWLIFPLFSLLLHLPHPVNSIFILLGAQTQSVKFFSYSTTDPWSMPCCLHPQSGPSPSPSHPSTTLTMVPAEITTEDSAWSNPAARVILDEWKRKTRIYWGRVAERDKENILKTSREGKKNRLLMKNSIDTRFLVNETRC